MGFRMKTRSFQEIPKEEGVKAQVGLEYEDMLDDFNELKVDEKVIKKDAEEMFEFKMIDLGTSAIF